MCIFFRKHVWHKYFTSLLKPCLYVFFRFADGQSSIIPVIKFRWVIGHVVISPLCLLAVNFEDRWWLLQNNFDPDEAPQDVGPHLSSNLFNNQIYTCIYQHNFLYKMMDFCYFWNKTKSGFFWGVFRACKEFKYKLVLPLACQLNYRLLYFSTAPI